MKTQVCRSVATTKTILLLGSDLALHYELCTQNSQCFVGARRQIIAPMKSTRSPRSWNEPSSHTTSQGEDSLQNASRGQLAILAYPWLRIGHFL